MLLEYVALGGRMSKTVKMILIFAGIGALIYWIRKANPNPAVPFGASAPVAPSVPTNVNYAGLANTPKLMQN